ncbi:sigma-54 interaction domain-containing protein [Pseudalkalibacillus hwajinpoensis]|uniref:HTH-type transcriptional regulatory protein TyrR n=1 Tax=Guptibacillus hwajinpoensis TaxID=208199 RepID=A0A4U1MDS6_9BACL|nr:sigma 54-interacting transcriptional regulator [Pseudalkalibacillus hwajinpoensis]TKD68290.1 PAS domain-containing protein [Pseudalkalibacillus hwajinpoensis]
MSEWNEYKAIFHSLQEDILVTDIEGTIVKVSEGTGMVYGVKADDLIGRSVYELEKEGLFTPLATPMVLKSSKRVTFVQTGPAGKKLLVTGLPVFEEGGQLVRIVSYSHDITELMEIKSGMEEMSLEMERVRSELERLKLQQEDTGIIAKSEAMRKVMATAKQVAGVDVNVLLLGESGVGKTEMARYIHRKSDRRDGPFIEVNCGAIPEALFEAELFGYEEGSFTGARKGGRMGLAEMASSGTLFLDEVGELSLQNQVKVLKLIQEKRFYRLGGGKEIQSDFRLLSATNRNLDQAVFDKTFREDLFFRLNVVPLNIPPLNDRKEDILPLIQSFLDRFCEEYKRKRILDKFVIHELSQYEWRGNVRELMNLIERLVVTSDAFTIQASDLPINYRLPDEGYSEMNNFSETLQESLEKVEKERLQIAKRQFRTTTKIAAALGLSQPTVVRKLKKYRI